MRGAGLGHSASRRADTATPGTNSTGGPAAGPKSAAPTGRRKNVSANDAYACTSPSTPLPPSGVKDRAALIAVQQPWTPNSYHP